MVDRVNHAGAAEALRLRTLTGPGETAPGDRQMAAEVAAGEAASDTPYGRLAHQIGQAAYRVTDAQVAEVLAMAGSEKAAFEIIASATLGAGLKRWDKALAVLGKASHAAS